MTNYFQQLIQNFRSYFDKGAQNIQNKAPNTEKEKQIAKNMDFAIEKSRYDVIENLLKEQAPLTNQQLKKLLSYTGWLRNDNAEFIKNHLAKNYELELIEVFHENIQFCGGNTSSWVNHSIMSPQQDAALNYLQQKTKEYASCEAILVFFPDCFKGQVKAYYAYKDILSQTTKDINGGVTEVAKHWRSKMSLSTEYSLDQLIKNTITPLQNLLSKYQPLFDTPVEYVRVILDENNQPKQTLDRNEKERALLSQKVEGAKPVNLESPISMELDIPAIAMTGNKELVSVEVYNKLPQQAQGVLKEIGALCEALSATNKSTLTVEEQFILSNTIDNNLPQALKDYVSINPLYKSILKTEDGKTVEDLLVESLGQIKNSLFSIVERTEKEKFKNLQTTHKYLTAKR